MPKICTLVPFIIGVLLSVILLIQDMYPGIGFSQRQDKDVCQILVYLYDVIVLPTL